MYVSYVCLHACMYVSSILISEKNQERGLRCFKMAVSSLSNLSVCACVCVCVCVYVCVCVCVSGSLPNHPCSAM